MVGCWSSAPPLFIIDIEDEEVWSNSENPDEFVRVVDVAETAVNISSMGEGVNFSTKTSFSSLTLILDCSLAERISAARARASRIEGLFCMSVGRGCET